MTAPDASGADGAPALPLPVRVLVKGASTVNWISWMGGPRTDFILPRVIEERLLASGRPCTVHTHSVASEPTHGVLQTWEREVLGFSPDAIVLVYGHYETIHLLLPRWLERHANSLRGRPRRVRLLYRRRVVRPVWMFLARVQAAVDVRVGHRVRTRRHEKVVADLEAYVRHVRKVGSPLVHLVELLPPHEKYVSWFPGMPRRIHRMNEALDDLVRRFDDPEVRFVRVADLVDSVAGGDLAVAIPDGFHYSPAMHRAVGERIAASITQWAEGQPHLAP
ncbi:SGNH/GDSL hydrolase family protein [Aeromicrobium sp. Leaf245]|uniref:SGNH/GDSL hydrolase family protein n=1 Tax=Aeromicrobium sp. Leaf245 TaxID=1736306 RepID=UPI0006FF86D9|nr:SGNH/GDSL hydrolase family protein [Aeromicrobium sp. Leaf245]KQO42155.1 hypothetical protein ASF05_13935 [Aeromicrobium sp. Leaf245]